MHGREDCALSAQTCQQLLKQCQKFNLETGYRNKQDLILRLEDYFAQPTHSVPEKDFFMHTRREWKEAKKRLMAEGQDYEASRAEFFKDLVAVTRNEMRTAEIAPEDATSAEHVRWILRQKDPGTEMLKYYKRGKTAWMQDASDSSSGEEESNSQEDATETPAAAGATNVTAGESTVTAGETTAAAGESTTAARGPADEASATQPIVKRRTCTVFTDDDESDSSYKEEEEEEEEKQEEEEEDEGERQSDDSANYTDEQLLRSPEGSWLVTASKKKQVWRKQRRWQRRMRFLLPELDPTKWTMKRYMVALVTRMKLRCKKGATAREMAYMLENIDDEAKRRDEKNWCWSARTDSARLLACMFGTLEMRQSFVMAKQPLTKQQLDSRLDETPSQKYWTTVAQLFSDPEHRVHVGVKDAVVTSYLQVQKKKMC